MPAQLFFVRHGEAEHNPLIVKGKAEANDAVLAEGRSILNPRLTDMGKEQAAGLATAGFVCLLSPPRKPAGARLA
jgi:broad specificity phosphatase PhoE